jgi:riboflavin transporter FmnP
LKTDAKTLAGTAILGTLVVVFDYSLKYSGFKIPFPWLPYLKFDFTGVPIVLFLLSFGLASGITTSAVALLAILARARVAQSALDIVVLKYGVFHSLFL